MRDLAAAAATLLGSYALLASIAVVLYVIAHLILKGTPL